MIPIGYVLLCNFELQDYEKVLSRCFFPVVHRLEGSSTRPSALRSSWQRKDDAGECGAVPCGIGKRPNEKLLGEWVLVRLTKITSDHDIT